MDYTGINLGGGYVLKEMEKYKLYDYIWYVRSLNRVVEDIFIEKVILEYRAEVDKRAGFVSFWDWRFKFGSLSKSLC